MALRIEAMVSADWPEVRRIYEEGLATGVGSFEIAAPSWEEWNAARLPHSRLVARAWTILGWAALSPVSQRSCYAGVAEVAVYVAASARGEGVGRALLVRWPDLLAADGCMRWLWNAHAREDHLTDCRDGSQ